MIIGSSFLVYLRGYWNWFTLEVSRRCGQCVGNHGYQRVRINSIDQSSILFHYSCLVDSGTEVYGCSSSDCGLHHPVLIEVRLFPVDW